MFFCLRSTSARRRIACLCVLTLTVFVLRFDARAYTRQYMTTNAAVAVRWYQPTISVALSSSLATPPANFRGGSDLRGAAQRALARWSAVANINFQIVDSNLVEANSSDGVNLITVAPTTNNNRHFANNNEIGRAVVAYSRTNGAITDGDILLSTVVTSSDPSRPRQFATDGSPDYYDAEEVFVHEVGHFLGLDHTANIAASMRPYTIHSDDYFTGLTGGRTLASDDILGIQSIYGVRSTQTASQTELSGTITDASGAPVVGAHVWVENARHGLIAGGSITLPDGSYKIQGLAPGTYRARIDALDAPVSRYDVNYVPDAAPAFRALEIKANVGKTSTRVRSMRNSQAAGNLQIVSGTSASRDFQLNTAQSASLNIQGIGVLENGGYGIGYAAVPFTPGATKTVLLIGAGLTALLPEAGGSLEVSSAFASVRDVRYIGNASLNGQTIPIIGMSVTFAATAPLGDYTVRGQSASGELVFQSGGITIESAANLASGILENPTTAYLSLAPSINLKTSIAVLDFTPRNVCVELRES